MLQVIDNSCNVCAARYCNIVQSDLRSQIMQTLFCKDRYSNLFRLPPTRVLLSPVHPSLSWPVMVSQSVKAEINNAERGGPTRQTHNQKTLNTRVGNENWQQPTIQLSDKLLFNLLGRDPTCLSSAQQAINYPTEKDTPCIYTVRAFSYFPFSDIKQGLKHVLVQWGGF